MTENAYSENNEKVIRQDESTVKHIYKSEKYDDEYVFGVYTDSVSTTNSSEPIRELIEQLQLAIGTIDIELQDTYTRIESTETVVNDIEVRFELLGKDIPVEQITALFDICYDLNKVDETTSLNLNKSSYDNDNDNYDDEPELQLTTLSTNEEDKVEITSQDELEDTEFEIDVHVTDIGEWTLYSITYTLLSYTPE